MQSDVQLMLILVAGQMSQAEAARSISRALKHNTSLKQLNLYGECAAQNVDQMINDMLTIAGNGIGDQGATVMALALKTNNTLTELYIRCE